MFCSVAWVWVCLAVASCIVVCATAKSDCISAMVCWPACAVRFVTVRWLSAAICAAELVPVGDAVTAANTATACSCERIACSLACAPYCTVCDESIRAVDDARAEPGPELPVYQETVSAVPLTSDVAEPNGEPPTRS